MEKTHILDVIEARFIATINDKENEPKWDRLLRNVLGHVDPEPEPEEYERWE